MESHEVPEPILNGPFECPNRYWFIREGEPADLRNGRRPSIVYPPREQRVAWNMADGTLKPAREYPSGYEMMLVNTVRERVNAWRNEGYPGVTRTTRDLLTWWRREGRQQSLFFAQLEAVETIIFLVEARADFLQGIHVPRDEPGPDKQAEGARGFTRYACKMATGAGKTTVMGMLAAWSILNKVTNRSDGRFSDMVLVVCPNLTIRNRLRELDPNEGEASLYRTRDLVQSHQMPQLVQGRVVVTNWHVFEPHGVQTGGVSAKVVKTGVPLKTRERVTIGPKTTMARGSRYLTLADYRSQVAAGLLTVLEEEQERDGTLKRVLVESVRYVESDTALLNRVLGRQISGKKNILVMNDEAHHAYRIRREEDDPDQAELFDPEEDDEEEFFKEATVWVDGLDRVQKRMGVNLCVDLSATPYFLGRVGQDTNRPFPWIVSDFGLTDAIEAGLVKIPQLAVRDTTGAAIPGYFNIWQWILPQLTPAERGANRASPKPEAILKYANHPLAMLGGLWETEKLRWEEGGMDDRPPVFIVVCKNTRIAKSLYEWLAEDKNPTGIPPAKIEGFRNRDGQTNTIRVDTKVVNETDTGNARSDESRWMRLTLDTVGKLAWPIDRLGRPLYPEGFEALAGKLNRPLHPPGRNVRCIISVGMLTEGWDCNTVTHVIGLRPFMSQLLCEQVVGRGLRRASYEMTDDGKFREEVAAVFGVPFEVIPFKANPQGPAPRPPKQKHVHAIPSKVEYEISFPRVEGYTRAIRSRVTVDWPSVPTLVLEPGVIPPEVQIKGLSLNNQGRMTLSGPGRLDEVSLAEFRSRRRVQELVFDLSQTLARDYLAQRECDIPPHVLFPQLAAIIRRYLAEKVVARPPADLKDLFLAPYYGWAVERLLEAIRSDSGQGEAPEAPRYETSRPPGSTAEVNFWTSREVREVQRSHLNYVVADTKKWEQSAAYFIDRHRATSAFVKNAGLGFAIPYLHNGQMHDYIPDFIIRLTGKQSANLILETKGYDLLDEVKREAANRWVNAVNVDGSYGCWKYSVAKDPSEVNGILTRALE